MKRRYLLSLLTLLTLSGQNLTVNALDESTNTYYVRFLDNKEQAVATYSGFEAKGANLLFTYQNVKENEKVEIPEVTPSVEGYKFNGWYKEKSCITLYDFDAKVTSNLTLYAGYERDSSAIIEDEFKEVKLTFIETINDDLDIPLSLSGVLNTTISDDLVYLSSNAIAKLNASSDDCLKYLNYQRKSDVTDLNATYANNKITLNYKYDSVDYQKEITISTNSYTLSNSTYESKAKKFDAYNIEDYSIILAGSSSMEFWSSSATDLKEFTTTNIGIGGTKVSEWDEQLNERLVYPNNPRAVVYYLGINNIINNGNSGTETGNMLVTMFDHIHERLPDTTIYFVLINYVPGYMQHKASINTANLIVKDYAKDKDYMVLIDAGSLLMQNNGEPSWAYFRTDGLHMSLAGYILWGGKVKETLIETEKKLYGEN